MSNIDFLPSVEEVKAFQMLYPMLVADLTEMRELSKKKQDGVVNALKVKIINKKLEKIKSLLENQPTEEFLELLDEETLPTNSDAVFMILQFKSGMKHFEDRYYTKTYSEFGKSWKTRGESYEEDMQFEVDE